MNDTQGMLLGIAGLVCGMMAIGAALWCYRRGERWRRMQLAASEVKEFESDPAVRRVRMLLGHPRRVIDLDIGGRGELPVFIDEETMMRALEVDGAPYDMEFTPEERAIREMVDLFLCYLSRFENHIRVGLIEPEDVRCHLARSLTPIGGNDALAGQLRRFAMAHRHDDAMALCERYDLGGLAPGRHLARVPAHA